MQDQIEPRCPEGDCYCVTVIVDQYAADPCPQIVQIATYLQIGEHEIKSRFGYRPTSGIVLHLLPDGGHRVERGSLDWDHGGRGAVTARRIVASWREMYGLPPIRWARAQVGSPEQPPDQG